MTTWNEATPAGTDYISGGDDIIRDFKIATRERLAREHAMLGSGDDSADGKHRLAHGLAADRPTAVAGHVYIATDTLIVSVSPADGVWIDLRSDDPPGFMKLYAGSLAPSGWLICDGSAVSRTTYAALFAVISTFYGIGDGVTTFNLPNLKGRVPIGVDTTKVAYDVIGDTGGEETHQLTAAELASHVHGVTDPGHVHNVARDISLGVAQVINATQGVGNSFPIVGGALSAVTGVTIDSAGSDAYHNNMQPYLALNYVIKY